MSTNLQRVIKNLLRDGNRELYKEEEIIEKKEGI